MSQMSGVAGDGLSVDPGRSAATGRAVGLLAVAVVAGILLLQALDTPPSATTTATEVTGESPQAAVTETTLPIAPQVRTPSEVRVLVANGTTVNGAASRVAGRLQPIGYQLLVPGNTTSPSSSSTVQYAEGFQAEAQALATSLGIAAPAVRPLPDPSPVQDLQQANVVVIVGSELSGQSGAQTQTQQPTNPLDGPLSGSQNQTNTQNQATSSQNQGQQSPQQAR